MSNFSEIKNTSSISETSIESEIIAESKSLYSFRCWLSFEYHWTILLLWAMVTQGTFFVSGEQSRLIGFAKCWRFQTNICFWSLLKNNELTFKDALDSLASQLDSSASGYFRLQPLEKLPFGLNNVVPNLKVGEYSYPLKLGEGFCIIALESFVPSSLDVDTQELLLLQYLDQWIDAAVKHLIFLYDGYH